LAHEFPPLAAAGPPGPRNDLLLKRELPPHAAIALEADFIHFLEVSLRVGDGACGGAKNRSALG